MAEIINLRRIRKARRRSDDDKAADINRAAFGRSRAERDTAVAEIDRATRRLDAHRLASSKPSDADPDPAAG